MKKIIFIIPFFFLGCSQTERDSFAENMIQTVKENEDKSPEELKVVLEQKYEEGKIKAIEYTQKKLEDANLTEEDIALYMEKYKELQNTN